MMLNLIRIVPAPEGSSPGLVVTVEHSDGTNDVWTALGVVLALELPPVTDKAVRALPK